LLTVRFYKSRRRFLILYPIFSLTLQLSLWLFNFFLTLGRIDLMHSMWPFRMVRVIWNTGSLLNIHLPFPPVKQDFSFVQRSDRTWKVQALLTPFSLRCTDNHCLCKKTHSSTAQSYWKGGVEDIISGGRNHLFYPSWTRKYTRGFTGLRREHAVTIHLLDGTRYQVQLLLQLGLSQLCSLSLMGGFLCLPLNSQNLRWNYNEFYIFTFFKRQYLTVALGTGWLGTHYVEQTSFELIEIHLPLPRVLGFKQCAFLEVGCGLAWTCAGLVLAVSLSSYVHWLCCVWETGLIAARRREVSFLQWSDTGYINHTLE
jgi:hypothetical protein